MSSVDAILDGRYVLWRDALDAWGYELEDPPRASWLPCQFVIFARRPETYGGPAVSITVAEQWAHGGDPHGLSLVRNGCYLRACSWHAHFSDAGSGDPSVVAERLDVDRTKHVGLTVHRHPFGFGNDHRDGLDRLPEPDDWIYRIESIVAGIVDP